MRQYKTRFTGALLGISVSAYFVFSNVEHLLNEYFPSCVAFSPCTNAEVLWILTLLFVIIIPLALGGFIGWRYLPGAFTVLSNEAQRLSTLAAEKWREQPAAKARLIREAVIVPRRTSIARALFVLFLVVVLVVLQTAFLSVVVDAVDGQYLQSDRYHITAGYLVRISELLFAAAIAVGLGNLVSSLPYVRSSQTAFVGGFLVSFLVSWLVIADVRARVVESIIADRGSEDRRYAALVAINQMALVRDGLKFEEADLGLAEMATPDAKIILFLSPVIFYLAGVDSLEETYPDKVETLLRALDEDGIVRRIQEEANQETRQYCAFFEQMYAEYTGGVNEGVQSISDASGGGLGSERTYEEASRYYFNKVEEKLGRGWSVLPGLTREQFINHRDVQRAIKGQIRDNLPAMRAQAAASEFPVVGEQAVTAFERAVLNQNVYVDPCDMNERIVRGISSDLQKTMRQEVDRALAPGSTTLGASGEHADYGRTALEIAILPSLSITTLLVGMILSGRNVIGLVTVRVLSGWRTLELVLLLAFLGFALLWPFSRPHAQLDAGPIAVMMDTIQAEHGALSRYGIEWIVRGATGLYYAGADLRERLDLDMMGLEGHIAHNLDNPDLGPGLGPEALASP